jgi:AcrR family transcriptional regulator
MPRQPARHPAAGSAGRAYRGSSADQRRTERHARLIEAGIRVIGRDGYRATTVRSVCAEAGLTERYFYEAFGDREALLGAAYTHLVSTLQQQIAATLMKSDLSKPADLVRIGLHEFFTKMRDNTDAARILLFEVLNVSPEVTKLTQTAINDFARIITTMARALQVPVDAREEELVMAGLVGSVVFIAITWNLEGYSRPIDDVVSSALSIFSAVLNAHRT